jgi:hypothetical protein
LDVKTALSRILETLKNCEGDIESILSDLYQRGYDDGFGVGKDEGISEGEEKERSRDKTPYSGPGS